MLLAKATALAAVLALGACTAIIDHPTSVATSQPQDAITPEIPNLKPFPPEEPPAVITASPEQLALAIEDYRDRAHSA
jgi:hypothetical protein